MHKSLPALLSLLLFSSGCSVAAANYERTVSPQPWTILEVGPAGTISGQNVVPAGRYDLENDESVMGNNALFAIYISDTYYPEMSMGTETDLVTVLPPDQDITVNLNQGNYVYVAAISQNTGVYEDGLRGKLRMDRDN